MPEMLTTFGVEDREEAEDDNDGRFVIALPNNRKLLYLLLIIIIIKRSSETDMDVRMLNSVSIVIAKKDFL